VRQARKSTKAGQERHTGRKKANNTGRQGKAHNLPRKGTKAGNIKWYKGRE
jgi:hypothetical protein